MTNQLPITISYLQTRIAEIRTELENRHKYGTIKMSADGAPIQIATLQDEMFRLIYRKSKLEQDI